MTTTSQHDAGDDLRRLWAKAQQRRKIKRISVACCFLLLSIGLAWWFQPALLFRSLIVEAAR